MRRTTLAALPLVAALALLSPGRALAGQPEGASGKMVFDEVADGLRRYRREKDPERQVKVLDGLAATRDPRVAVLLGELLDDPAAAARKEAVYLVWRYYIPRRRHFGLKPTFARASRWWKENEDDLRRRAKEMTR